MTPRVFVLNGPNLNRLGRREPVYGTWSADDLARELDALAAELGLDVELRQSNHEGVLIDWAQEAADVADAVILNPAGFTTTSVGLRDAIGMLTVPFVECHITNIHAREPWRRDSLFSGIAAAVIVGAGLDSYRLALRHVASLLAAEVRK
jgi:3-dehydroquinate dehydratase II